MKFIFDKTQPRLTVSEIPVEATKVELTIPEQKVTLSANNGQPIEIGNFSFSLVGTLFALKEEQVETPVVDEGGNQIDVTISTEVTVLESQAIDLKVL